MLDNELVNQKNAILSLANNGEYRQALTLLEFVKGLWESCSYGYKHREVKERIKRDVLQYMENAHHWKSQKAWESLLADVEKA